VKKNQGKYHLVSLFMIPSVFAAYFLGGITTGLIVTAVLALLILLVFQRD
jgi:hypothetical protein